MKITIGSVAGVSCIFMIPLISCYMYEAPVVMPYLKFAAVAAEVNITFKGNKSLCLLKLL